MTINAAQTRLPAVSAKLYRLAADKIFHRVESLIRGTRVVSPEQKKLILRSSRIALEVLRSSTVEKERRTAAWFIQYQCFPRLDLTVREELVLFDEALEEFRQIMTQRDTSQSEVLEYAITVSFIGLAMAEGSLPGVYAEKYVPIMDALFDCQVANIRAGLFFRQSPVAKVIKYYYEHPSLPKAVERREALIGEVSTSTAGKCTSLATYDFSWLKGEITEVFNLLALYPDSGQLRIIMAGIDDALLALDVAERAENEKTKARIDNPTYSQDEYKNISDLRERRRTLVSIVYGAAANNPSAFTSLLVSLTSRILAGAFPIRDGVIIQQSIAKLLHGVSPAAYGLVRTLILATPYSFRVLGATGLNDPIIQLSRSLDDSGTDPLMRVLRIDIHSGQAKANLDHAEAIMRYWLTGDESQLDALKTCDAYIISVNEFPELAGQDFVSPEIEELQKGMAALLGGSRISDLIVLSSEEIDRRLSSFFASRDICQKIGNMARLYSAIAKKYGGGTVSAKAITEWDREANPSDFLPIISPLKKQLGKALLKHEANGVETTTGLLDAIANLRRAIRREILTPSDIVEELAVEYKRHIAPGREGMYGTYKEEKFDLFNYDRKLETFGLEFAEKVSASPLFGSTGAELALASRIAIFLIEMLDVNGGSNHRLRVLAETLADTSLSPGQIRDVFAQILEELSAAVDRTNTSYAEATASFDPKMHEAVLASVLRTNRELELLGALSQKVLSQIQPPVVAVRQSRAQEEVPFPADNFYLIDGSVPVSVPPGAHVRFGSKGAGLIEMASIGLSVPPAILISTELFHQVVGDRTTIRSIEEINFPPAFIAGLRARWGNLVAADQSFPGSIGFTLLSVRSGSFVSLPGMMETITNIGLNAENVAVLAEKSGRPWFAWDCYRRLQQDFGMSLGGIQRTQYEALMEGAKHSTGVAKKADFTPYQMETLARSYADLTQSNVVIPEEPFEQVLLAIRLVIRSWFGERAVRERQFKGISEDWGTGLVVQAMRFGNLNAQSGSGVLFSRGLEGLGDYASQVQGADLVDGVTFPVPIFPASGRAGALSLVQPAVAEQIRECAQRIDDFTGEAADIEITVQDGRLYALQMRGFKRVSWLSTARVRSRRVQSNGIFGFGGAVQGVAVFRAEDVSRIAEQGQKPILVGGYLVPDQAQLVADAAGFVPAKGGPTSHMAVLARRHGQTMVGGISMEIVEDGRAIKIGNLVIHAGDPITVDGFGKIVLSGHVPIK